MNILLISKYTLLVCFLLMTNISARRANIRRSSRNRRSLDVNQSQTSQSIRRNARNPSVANPNRGSNRSYFDLPHVRRSHGDNLKSCLEQISRGQLPSILLHCHPKIKIAQTKFLNKMGKDYTGMAWCPFCNERSLTTVRSSHSIRNSNRLKCCKRCHDDLTANMNRRESTVGSTMDEIDRLSYGKSNGMDPWPRYDHLLLPKLNPVEEMIIARIHPFMRVYRLSGGTAGYKGSICSFEQDVISFIRNLPNLPSDLPLMIVRKPNANLPNGFSEFKVNRAHIIQWLVFLKQNNPHYKDIDISLVRERANSIPEDGSIESHIQVFTPGKFLFVDFSFSSFFSCIDAYNSKMILRMNLLPLCQNKTEALRPAELLVILVETELPLSL